MPPPTGPVAVAMLELAVPPKWAAAVAAPSTKASAARRTSPRRRGWVRALMPPRTGRGGESWRLARSRGAQAGRLQHVAEHALGGEVLAGQLGGGPGVASPVGLDRLDGRDRAVEVGEGEEALAHRQDATEAGVLGDR